MKEIKTYEILSKPIMDAYLDDLIMFDEDEIDDAIEHDREIELYARIELLKYIKEHVIKKEKMVIFAPDEPTKDKIIEAMERRQSDANNRT